MTVKTLTSPTATAASSFPLMTQHILKEVRTEEFPPMTDVKQGILDAIYHRRL